MCEIGLAALRQIGKIDLKHAISRHACTQQERSPVINALRNGSCSQSIANTIAQSLTCSQHHQWRLGKRLTHFLKESRNSTVGRGGERAGDDRGHRLSWRLRK